MNNFYDRFTRWLQQPFRRDMDVIGWALFVALIIALIVMWNNVLERID